MGGSNSGRIEVNGLQVLTGMQKRIRQEERRPLIRTASDLLGPGLGPYAVRLMDFNDDAAVFNGLFYAEPGAQNGPDTNRYWMGQVIANADGYGYQRMAEFRAPADPLFAPVEYIRTFTSIGSARSYGTWLRVGSGTVKKVVSTTILANTGPTVGGTGLNCASAVVPYPYLNRTYRVTFNVEVQSDTAGGFTTFQLKYGVGAITGGTVFMESLLDHRVASRRILNQMTGEFVCPVADGTADFRVIVVFFGGAGASTTVASSTAPSYLLVDEIIP